MSSLLTGCVYTPPKNQHHSPACMWSFSKLSTPLLPDGMWVRELSHAQPCSKTVLFISSVTLLCNVAVCMCTVGGGGGGGGPAGGQDISADFAPPTSVLSLCLCLLRHLGGTQVTERNLAEKARRGSKYQLTQQPLTLRLRSQIRPSYQFKWKLFHIGHYLSCSWNFKRLHLGDIPSDKLWGLNIL